MKLCCQATGRWIFLISSLAIISGGCSDPSSEKAPPSQVATSPGNATPPLETTPRAEDRAGPTPGQQFHVEKIPEQARQRIRLEKVQKRLTPHAVTAPGHVDLDLTQVAKVSARIPGQIENIMVHLGNRVQKNQPLAAVESLMLDELVQEYLVAKSKMDVAKSNFARTQSLAEQNIISQRRFLEDRGQQIEAQAVYQHVREKLLNMGLSKQELEQLEHGSHMEGHKYLLRAPLKGTVISQNIVLGQGVTPGDELFEIVDTSRVWVFANLPIEQARLFEEGDEGQVFPKGGEPITAELAYIAPIADPTTRTVRVRFDVDNRKGYLKPNEYVEVRLVDQQQPLLSIPLSALTMLEGVRGVFVKRDSGYDFVVIETGQEGGGLIEVEQGLKLGEQVVVEGVFDLKNAMMKTAIQEE